jgi:hypothetical protein
MSDPGLLRRVLDTYDNSYPPSILGGGGGSPTDPHIDTVVPNSFPVTTTTIITITGRNFSIESVIEIDQLAVVGQANTEEEMIYNVVSGSLGVGTHQVTVRNIDDQESNSVPIVVTATVVEDEPEPETESEPEPQPEPEPEPQPEPDPEPAPTTAYDRQVSRTTPERRATRRPSDGS